MNAVDESKVILRLNMKDRSVLPENFHTMKDGFLLKDEVMPSREGLDGLLISGSGQFSEKSLKVLIKKVNHPGRFYLVDLRQESHGFMKGHAISWHSPLNWSNVGKSLAQIETIERKRVQTLSQQKSVLVHKITKKETDLNTMPETQVALYDVGTVQQEKDLSEKLKMTYVRLPISDHVKPTDDIVDEFVDFTMNLPKDAWIHFHCGAGLGRTTTIMIMFDMMKNADRVSFEDILKRQWMMGGMNVYKNVHKDHWKLSIATERVEFLKDFYLYCLQQKPMNFEKSWSLYLLEKKIQPSSTIDTHK